MGIFIVILLYLLFGISNFYIFVFILALMDEIKKNGSYRHVFKKTLLNACDEITGFNLTDSGDVGAALFLVIAWPFLVIFEIFYGIFVVFGMFLKFITGGLAKKVRESLKEDEKKDRSEVDNKESTPTPPKHTKGYRAKKTKKSKKTEYDPSTVVYVKEG